MAQAEGPAHHQCYYYSVLALVQGHFHAQLGVRCHVLKPRRPPKRRSDSGSAQDTLRAPAQGGS